MSEPSNHPERFTSHGEHRKRGKWLRSILSSMAHPPQTPKDSEFPTAGKFEIDVHPDEETLITLDSSLYEKDTRHPTTILRNEHGQRRAIDPTKPVIPELKDRLNLYDETDIPQERPPGDDKK